MNIALSVIEESRPQTAEVGRYVVDFGHETAVGFTARQVAELLESERFRDVRVYRIHQAYPDGRMELVGVSLLRFEAEDCFLFHRTALEAARGDFEGLRAAAAKQPPPCRVRVHLTRLSLQGERFVTAALFPAEYAEEMSAWLLRLGYQGGDTVECGVSHASGYAAMSDAVILDRLQLWGTQDGTRAEQTPATPGAEAIAS